MDEIKSEDLNVKQEIKTENENLSVKEEIKSETFSDTENGSESGQGSDIEDESSDSEEEIVEKICYNTRSSQNKGKQELAIDTELPDKTWPDQYQEKWKRLVEQGVHRAEALFVVETEIMKNEGIIPVKQELEESMSEDEDIVESNFQVPDEILRAGLSRMYVNLLNEGLSAETATKAAMAKHQINLEMKRSQSIDKSSLSNVNRNALHEWINRGLTCEEALQKINEYKLWTATVDWRAELCKDQPDFDNAFDADYEPPSPKRKYEESDEEENTESLKSEKESENEEIDPEKLTQDDKEYMKNLELAGMSSDLALRKVMERKMRIKETAKIQNINLKAIMRPIQRKRFHEYLDEGFDYETALKMAKNFDKFQLNRHRNFVRKLTRQGISREEAEKRAAETVDLELENGYDEKTKRALENLPEQLTGHHKNYFAFLLESGLTRELAIEKALQKIESDETLIKAHTLYKRHWCGTQKDKFCKLIRQGFNWQIALNFVDNSMKEKQRTKAKEQQPQNKRQRVESAEKSTEELVEGPEKFQNFVRSSGQANYYVDQQNSSESRFPGEFFGHNQNFSPMHHEISYTDQTDYSEDIKYDYNSNSFQINGNYDNFDVKDVPSKQMEQQNLARDPTDFEISFNGNENQETNYIDSGSSTEKTVNKEVQTPNHSSLGDYARDPTEFVTSGNENQETNCGDRNQIESSTEQTVKNEVEMPNCNNARDPTNFESSGNEDENQETNLGNQIESGSPTEQTVNNGVEMPNHSSVGDNSNETYSNARGSDNPSSVYKTDSDLGSNAKYSDYQAPRRQFNQMERNYNNSGYGSRDLERSSRYPYARNDYQTSNNRNYESSAGQTHYHNRNSSQQMHRYGDRPGPYYERRQPYAWSSNPEQRPGNRDHSQRFSYNSGRKDNRFGGRDTGRQN